MYVAFSWVISPNSLNSSEIKQLVNNALGGRQRQIVLANFMVVRLNRSADYDALCVALEDVAAQHIGEFDYVCLRCNSRVPFRPLLATRAGWNTHAIEEIIT